MDYIIAPHEHVEQTLWHLAVIAERAMEGIVVFDLNGAIRFVNAAWMAMHGYETAEELIGKQISVFHTKEQMKADVFPFIEEVKRRGRLAGPVEHVRRNGTPFPTETLMVVFKDRAGKAVGLIGFATDITEHERTKDELKRFRNCLAEFVKQRTDQFKAANEQLQHEVSEHQQAEQRLKRQIAELSVENERLQDQIYEHEAVKNQLQGYCDQLEQRLREQNDELTVANEQIQREITERKQAEEHLRQQIDELKAANEQFQDQINKLSARGHIGEADVRKARGLPKAAASLTRDEKAILVNVFRQNVTLQKSERDSDVVSKTSSNEMNG